MSLFQAKRSRVNEPRTTGAAKVPVVMQLESLECGAASPANNGPFAEMVARQRVE